MVQYTSLCRQEVSERLLGSKWVVRQMTALQLSERVTACWLRCLLIR